MSEETPLTDHEKQHLNALKLFLERSSDLKVLESGKVIDALSPEKGREVLDLYNRALKNPHGGSWRSQFIYFAFYKILPTCVNVLRLPQTQTLANFACGTSMPNARNGPKPTLFRCVS